MEINFSDEESGSPKEKQAESGKEGLRPFHLIIYEIDIGVNLTEKEQLRNEGTAFNEVLNEKEENESWNKICSPGQAIKNEEKPPETSKKKVEEPAELSKKVVEPAEASKKKLDEAAELTKKKADESAELSRKKAEPGEHSQAKRDEPSWLSTKVRNESVELSKNRADEPQYYRPEAKLEEQKQIKQTVQATEKQESESLKNRGEEQSKSKAEGEDSELNKQTTRDKIMDIIEFTYQEWKERDECFERALVTCQYYCKLLENEGTNANIERNLEESLEVALGRLEIETELDGRLKQMLEACEGSLKSKQWKGMYQKLCDIMKKIRFLNISEVKRLVGKIKDAAKSIEEKDICLLLGGTGTGKSTTTHYLAGSKMREVKVKGMPHIEPESNDAFPWIIREIRCSPCAVSETRYITAVNMKVKFKLGVKEHEQEIALCDTPGFEDTEGPEVDIANGKGIVEALANTKSVRPLVFISKTDVGARLTGLRSLVRLLLDMMPNMKENLECFNYIFTRYEKEDRESIGPKLVDLYDQIENDKENENAALLLVIADMAEKTENPEAIHLVDPLDGKGANILKKLIKSKAIEKPKENFQTFLSFRSQSAISSQMNRDKAFIKKSFSRNEFGLIKSKLEDILFLKEVLGQSQNNSLNDFLKSVAIEIYGPIDQENKEILNDFERRLSPGNQLLLEDILSLKTNCDKMLRAKPLIEFMRAEIEDSGSAPDAESLLRGAQYLIKSAYEKSVGQDFWKEAEELRETMEKFSVISEVFVEFKEAYFNIEKRIRKEIQDLKSEEDQVKVLKSINFLSEKFSKFLPDLNEEVRASRKNIESSLTLLFEELERHFLGTFSAEKGENIKQILNKIKRLRESNSEYGYIFCNELWFTTKLQKASNAVQARAQNNSNTIDELLADKEGGSNFSQIEKPFAELYFLRSFNDEILAGIIPIYYSNFEKLRAFFRNVVEKVESILIQFESENEDIINYSSLIKALSVLDSGSWLKKYKISEGSGEGEEVLGGTMDEVNKCIEKYIIEYIEKTIKPIASLNLSSESEDRANNLKIVEKMHEKLRKLEPIEKRYGSVAKIIKDTSDNIDSKIIGEMNRIQLEMSPQHIEAILKENIGKFLLKALKRIKYIKTWARLEKFKDISSKVFGDIKLFFEGMSKVLAQTLENEYSDIVKYAEDEFSSFDMKEIGNKIEEFDRSYKSLEQLEVIFSELDQELERKTDWPSKLKELSYNLDKAMSEFMSVEKITIFNKSMALCKNLIQFDSMFKNERPFQVLFRKFNGFQMREASNNVNNLYDLIEKWDLGSLRWSLNELKKAKDPISENSLKRAISFLENQIESIKDEISRRVRTMLMRYPDEKSYTEIYNGINKLEKIKDLGDFMKVEEVLAFVEEIKQDKLKQILLKYIEFICSLIESFEYEQVEKEDKNLKLLLNIYNPDGGENTRSNEENKFVLATNAIDQNLQKLDRNLQKLGQTLKNQYKTVDDIMLNPPRNICLKLTNSMRFRDVSKELGTAVDKIVMNKYKEISNIESISSKKMELKKLNNLLKYTPDYIIDNYQVKVSTSLQEIENSEQNFAKEVKQALELNKPPEILLEYIKEIRKGNASSQIYAEIKKHLNAKSTSNAKETIELIEKDEFRGLVDFYNFFKVFREIESDLSLQSNKIDIEIVLLRQLKIHFDSLRDNVLMKEFASSERESGLEGIDLAKESNPGVAVKEDHVFSVIFDKILAITPSSAFQFFYPNFGEKMLGILNIFAENLERINDFVNNYIKNQEAIILKNIELKRILYF